MWDSTAGDIDLGESRNNLIFTVRDLKITWNDLGMIFDRIFFFLKFNQCQNWNKEWYGDQLGRIWEKITVRSESSAVYNYIYKGATSICLNLFLVQHIKNLLPFQIVSCNYYQSYLIREPSFSENRFSSSCKKDVINL